MPTTPPANPDAVDRRPSTSFARHVVFWLTVLLTAICLAMTANAATANAAPPDAAPANAWHMRPDGALTIQPDETEFVFRPELTLLFTEKDPKLAMRASDIKRVSYNVPTWFTGVKNTEGMKNVDTDVAGGDGLDPSILAGDTKGRTADALRAAPRAVLTASEASRSGDTVTWKFPAHPVADVTATVNLAGPYGPELTIRLQAKRAGFYSIGYTGAPATGFDDVEELWQPLVWSERRLPGRSFATASFECSAPGTLVQREGVTYGVMVDPAMLPFQPLPRIENSQFAVVLRDADGAARPMAFAPVLGGMNSQMQPGDETSLTAHLYVRPGKLIDAHQDVARRICRFRDHRRNLDISLNQTLANMTAYGLSKYANFNKDLRGCSYATDVPGAVKNVSALNPLSAALVFDDPAIYTERTLPIWEYLLSRHKLLFNLDPKIKTQGPSNKLIGPCANVSELAALHVISGKRDFVSRAYAEALYGTERTLNLDVPKRGNTWPAAMALHEATGDQRYAERRDAEIKRYLQQRIAVPPTDFSDRDAGGMFFWTAYAPLWIELHAAWMQTRDAQTLAAAAEAARYYTLFTWMLPIVPDTTVRVNEGGLAPHYWYLKSKGHEQMQAPEHDVPAWWVDALGLTPESSGTASGHRGIFMATYAPWMLRLAQDANEPFLRDVARSAVIGRYRNFPGYHINTARTDVYMQADYPLRSHEELGYNSFHYNHIWPMVSMLLDYLVSDVYDASDAAIDFPAHFAEGYAYLRQRVYGDQPGRFYDRDRAWLWMPFDLLAVDHPQLNYITARTDDEVLIALTNQSTEPVRATLALNAQLAGLGDGDHPVRIWQENKPVDAGTLHAGRIDVQVAPRGITALAVGACLPQTRFQHRVLDDRGRPLGQDAHQTIAAGDCRAMLLTMGRTLTSGYVYSRALPGKVKQITFAWRPLETDTPWKETVDTAYPFELSMPLTAVDAGIELKVTVEHTDGRVEPAEAVTLRR